MSLVKEITESLLRLSGLNLAIPILVEWSILASKCMWRTELYFLQLLVQVQLDSFVIIDHKAFYYDGKYETYALFFSSFPSSALFSLSKIHVSS